MDVARAPITFALGSLLDRFISSQEARIFETALNDAGYVVVPAQEALLPAEAEALHAYVQGDAFEVSDIDAAQKKLQAIGKIPT